MKNNTHSRSCKSITIKQISQLFALVLITIAPLSFAQSVVFSGQTDTLALKLISPERVQLNKIYSWRAAIKQRTSTQKIDLASLKSSDIQVKGAMPAHGHGLPTKPIVSQIISVDDNQIFFEIQGLKFQMWGDWAIEIALPGLENPIESHFKLKP